MTSPSRPRDSGTSPFRRPPSSRQLTFAEIGVCEASSVAGTSCEPEQVHIQLGGAPGSMVVVFASADESTASSVEYWETSASAVKTAQGSRHAYSQLLYIENDLMDPPMGRPTADAEDLLALQDTTGWANSLPIFPYGRSSSFYNATDYASRHGGRPKKGLGEYKNPQMIYNSPLIHTVSLQGLTPGRSYSYRVGSSSRTFAFTYPHDHTAFSTTGDDDSSGGSGGSGGDGYPWTIGLTADLGQTEVSRRNVKWLRSALERQATDEGKGSLILLAGDLSYADGYYSRWDSFARMIEPLAATFPVMTTGGNHEIGSAEQWQSYNARHPMPHATSGSPSNLWWSRDVGPVHVISLCSYAATAVGSLQYAWLSRDLKSIVRARTPWVVVMMHAPWYNSNAGHIGEAERMRRDMEPLLYNASVDIVLSGHVHAYERTHPVYNGEHEPCGGIVYLNLGDGGNREGAYVPWLEPQPSWSAFRESSFGVGLLTFENATHASYNWTRSACGTTNATEHHMGLNDPKHCATVTPYGADNAVDPYAWTDKVWIVRREAARAVDGLSCASAHSNAVAATTRTAAAGVPGGSQNEPGAALAALWFDAGGRAAAFMAGVACGLMLALAAAALARACKRRRVWRGTRARTGGTLTPSLADPAKTSTTAASQAVSASTDSINVRVSGSFY